MSDDDARELSPRGAATIAGVAYVVIIVLAGFFYQGVLGRLREPGDAEATAAEIAGSEGLFRVGVLALVVVLIADAVVAWALYYFLRPVHRALSLLAAVFRWVYVAISAVGVLNLLIVMQLVRGQDHLAALDAGDRAMRAMLVLDAFDRGWTVGIVCFAVHLLLVGVLVVRSAYVPRAIGVVLMLAALGYLVDSCLTILVPDGADYTDLFWLVPGLVGEFWLTGWLLLRGGRRQATLARTAGMTS